MSTRTGITINGIHFQETRTERGGLRFFIDGKPTRKNEWLAAKAEAKRKCDAKAAKQKPIVPNKAESGSREHLDALSKLFGI